MTTYNKERLQEVLQVCDVHHALVFVCMHVERDLESVHLQVAEQKLRALLARTVVRSVGRWHRVQHVGNYVDKIHRKRKRPGIIVEHVTHYA